MWSWVIWVLVVWIWAQVCTPIWFEITLWAGCGGTEHLIIRILSLLTSKTAFGKQGIWCFFLIYSMTFFFAVHTKPVLPSLYQSAMLTNLLSAATLHGHFVDKSLVLGTQRALDLVSDSNKLQVCLLFFLSFQSRLRVLFAGTQVCWTRKCVFGTCHVFGTCCVWHQNFLI